MYIIFPLKVYIDQKKKKKSEIFQRGLPILRSCITPKSVVSQYQIKLENLHTRDKKKAFIHIPIRFNIKYCPAVVAILDFWTTQKKHWKQPENDYSCTVWFMLLTPSLNINKCEYYNSPSMSRVPLMGLEARLGWGYGRRISSES
jgi:hypothetical protein